MKNFLLLGLLFLIHNETFAQNKQREDIWSGNYIVKFRNNDSLNYLILDTLIINKTAPANPEHLAFRYESDLLRWSLVSKNDTRGEELIVRRFLFDLAEHENEYEEFGWTELHKADKMDCLDGGHFFICKTEPKTNVQISKEASYFTETGLFGVWLHYGLVELEKIK